MLFTVMASRGPALYVTTIILKKGFIMNSMPHFPRHPPQSLICDSVFGISVNKKV